MVIGLGQILLHPLTLFGDILFGDAQEEILVCNAHHVPETQIVD